MTKHNLRCAECGDKLKLKGQIVSCPKCKRIGAEAYSGSLTATILTIESQAHEDGRTLDVKSIGSDANGFLTFSFVELPNEVESEGLGDSTKARKRFA